MSEDEDTTVADFLRHEQVITHDLGSVLPVMAQMKSTRKWKRTSLYKKIGETVEQVLGSCENANYGEENQEAGPYLRAVAWNLDQGSYYDGILDVIHNHRLLNRADVYLLPAVDLGMPRTGLKNVARDLALELGLNYVFATSYLNLDQALQKNDETQMRGKSLHIEGNAILSRYPIKSFRSIALPAARDPLKMREKRLGAEKALVAEILWGEKSVITVCVHLDRHSSPRHRGKQLKYLLTELKRNYPGQTVLIGGDLQTTTFNTSGTLALAFSFLNKYFRGTHFIVEDHLPYPERHFDRHVFAAVEKCGFKSDFLNEVGVGTVHIKNDDLGRFKTLPRVISPLFLKRMEKALQSAGGQANLKLDWFLATPDVHPSQYAMAEKPKVVGGLYYNGIPVSTHDAILLDLDIQTPTKSEV